MPLAPINEYNSLELLYYIAQIVSPMALLPITEYNSKELLYIIAQNIGSGGGGGGVDTTAIARDGSRPPLTNITWNSKKITDLAYPTDNQDAATLEYVNAIVAGRWQFANQYDPTVTSLFPDSGTGPAGIVAAGDAFEIIEPGTMAGIMVFPGDVCVAKIDDADKTKPNEWILISGGIDYQGLQQLYIPGNYISTPVKDTATLSFGTVSRILQGLLIEIPFKCRLNYFIARTNSNVGGTPQAQFALYQITNLKTFNINRVAKSAVFNSNGSVLHTIAPDASVTLEAGWYMLFIERNAASATQSWLQYANNSLLPRIGWRPNDINSGGLTRGGAENLVSWTYSGSLPTTLTVGTDYDFLISSNVLALFIDITPV
jgi:hypothetical protein